MWGGGERSGGGLQENGFSDMSQCQGYIPLSRVGITSVAVHSQLYNTGAKAARCQWKRCDVMLCMSVMDERALYLLHASR